MGQWRACVTSCRHSSISSLSLNWPFLLLAPGPGPNFPITRAHFVLYDRKHVTFSCRFGFQLPLGYYSVS